MNSQIGASQRIFLSRDEKDHDYGSSFAPSNGDPRPALARSRDLTAAIFCICRERARQTSSRFAVIREEKRGRTARRGGGREESWKQGRSLSFRFARADSRVVRRRKWKLHAIKAVGCDAKASIAAIEHTPKLSCFLGIFLLLPLNPSSPLSPPPPLPCRILF